MDTKTNLGKTKAEIVYEIVLSLNAGNSGNIWSIYSNDDRVGNALLIYNKLVDKGVVVEM